MPTGSAGANLDEGDLLDVVYVDDDVVVAIVPALGVAHGRQRSQVKSVWILAISRAGGVLCEVPHVPPAPGAGDAPPLGPSEQMARMRAHLLLVSHLKCEKAVADSGLREIITKKQSLTQDLARSYVFVVMLVGFLSIVYQLHVNCF